VYIVKIKLALVLAFVLLLSACGNGEKVAEPKEEKTGSTEATNGDSGDSSEPTFSAKDLRQLTEAGEEYPVVELVTSKGSITIELYPDVAPKAVENFITHSKNGYYDGLTFHRVMNDFMIQGGDPLGTGTGGESIYGAPFEDEFSEKVMNFRGALSMANSGPNTNGSQFFIVQNPTIDENLQSQMKQAGYPQELIEAYVEHGGTPWLDYKHTVFGQVIKGLEVVDEIAAVEVDAASKPVEPVTIEKVNVKE
jgi:peptidyl-prolyl cis-trans isomerase B (cyclophilin B)